jgi:hypothetical protein
MGQKDVSVPPSAPTPEEGHPKFLPFLGGTSKIPSFPGGGHPKFLPLLGGGWRGSRNNLRVEENIIHIPEGLHISYQPVEIVPSKEVGYLKYRVDKHPADYI